MYDDTVRISWENLPISVKGKFIISDADDKLTWQEQPNMNNTVSVDPSYIANICQQHCSNITYGDVVNIFAILVSIITGVVMICRIAQFSLDFVTDRDRPSVFYPSIFDGTYESFFMDIIIIVLFLAVGLFCALAWIVTVPLIIFISVLLVARMFARMKKKIDQL